MPANLRQAARTLRRRPLLAAAVVVTTALGISATTAMVSVIDAVLLRPLPFPDPQRLVALQTINVRSGLLPGRSNPADIADWRREARGFTAIAAYSTGQATLNSRSGPERVTSVSAGQDLDRVLGARAVHGRWFEPADFASGSVSVMLTYELWRARFHGDPDIIGRSIEVNGAPRTVIGVIAPMAQPFPGEARAIWWPLLLPSAEVPPAFRSGVWMRALGRVAPEYTLQQAAEEMKRVVGNLRTRHPTTNQYRDIVVTTLQESMVGPVRPMLLLLTGAVALVLLIACANIANLLLAQAQEREREYALRRTLGANTAGVTRLVLTETTLLAGLGAGLGIVLAPALVRMLITIYPEAVPRAQDIAINWRVLTVAMLATALAAASSAIPALLRANRLDLYQVMRASERNMGSRREQRVRSALVMAQVALCVLLLIGGGVLLRTFAALSTTRLGFESQNLLSFNVTLTQQYSDYTRELAFYEGLLDRLRALPGVSQAGASTLLPMTTGEYLDGFRRENTDDQIPDLPIARLQNVTPGYLETLQMPLLAGRFVQSTDRASTAPVAVVNQTLADRYFNGDALGRRILFRGEWREIVGVVGDKRHRNVREVPQPDLYLPDTQSGDPRFDKWFVLRSAAAPETLVPLIRRNLAELDPGIALADMRLMDDRVQHSLAPDRFRALLIGAFASLALALAILGIYSLTAYNVTRQTREIGIRMALGEVRRTILARVLGRALRLAGSGAALGLMTAWFGTRFLRNFTLDSTAQDPLTFLLVPVILVAVATLAALVPAYRASRVDPLTVIR